MILPAGNPARKGDKPLENGSFLRRVGRNREIGSFEEFPTKELAKRELERIMERVNQSAGSR